MSMKNQNEIIDALGGTTTVANLFEITEGAVSQWRSEGIPKARLMYLKLLRPDLFVDAPELTDKAA